MLSKFFQVFVANESSSLEVKTAEGASSDEIVKTANGGSTLQLQLTNYPIICLLFFIFCYFYQLKCQEDSEKYIR